MRSRHALIRTLLILLTTAGSGGLASAATFHVPGDFPTIQQALDAVASGDTVLVHPQTWVGSLQFRGKDVTLQSTDGPQATEIRGNGGTTIDIGPLGAVVGFSVTQGSAPFGAGMAVHGSGTRIQGNVFQDNFQGAGGFGAAIGGNGASPTIEANRFRRNHCDSQFLSGVVAFVNSSSPRIVNNVFEDNDCRGINMTLPAGNGPEVINNTLVRNPVGIRIDRRVNTSAQIYRNNAIVGNQVGLQVEFGTEADNPTWQNNLLFDNGVNYQGIADQTGSAGNLAVDPRFADIAGGDYHLLAGSPAIDAGSSVGAPATDFDGRTRPFDGDGDGNALVDIGAFEFGRLIVISPPSGTYVTTQNFDLVFIIEDPRHVTKRRMFLDGVDITSALRACLVRGLAPPSDLTLRCPGYSLSTLPEGLHELSLTLDYDDGSKEKSVARWNVRRSIESPTAPPQEGVRP